ncbi:sensor histidine kinase [Heyndrickxia acidicola]|uniref:histidine kinase n=1 Tax=Heyndrickxia acidicola TaxID=209389 RepID=A0ABU6MIX8_9BACI|nr:ATP-binding protein [Heyndrickxia acidicola]MED1204626.1 histidine kinase [Heyndrickxia acidicola]
MNRLFVLLRLVNYALPVGYVIYFRGGLTLWQLLLSAMVCMFGVWDIWKKPDEKAGRMRLGVWLELAGVGLWIIVIPNSILFCALISPITRSAIHLSYADRLGVYFFSLAGALFYFWIYPIDLPWIAMIVITGILLYSSVIGELIRERELARRLVALSVFDQEQAASDRERVRISRQLHDTTGQYWTAVIRAIDVALALPQPENHVYLKKAREAAGLGLQEMRRLVRSWDEGERTAEQWLRYGIESLKQMEELTNVEIQLQLSPIDWNAFNQPDETGEAVARTMMEAVTNGIRHGKATKMAIWFQEKEDGISLYIRDNGASFLSETKGIGLKSLQELAMGLGGKLLIEGVPSRGTTVHLIVPFKGYDAVKEEKL